MKKIYVIFSGEYSDWDVHGYFTTKEEADKFCVLKNNTRDEEDDYCYCDDLYVEEIELLDDKFNLNKVAVKYLHEIVFDLPHTLWFKNRGFAMRNEPNRYKLGSGENKVLEVEYCNEWIAFKIYSDTDKRDGVEKISQDLYYQIMEKYNESGDLDSSILAVAEAKGFKSWRRW